MFPDGIVNSDRYTDGAPDVSTTPVVAAFIKFWTEAGVFAYSVALLKYLKLFGGLEKTNVSVGFILLDIIDTTAPSAGITPAP